MILPPGTKFCFLETKSENKKTFQKRVENLTKCLKLK